MPFKLICSRKYYYNESSFIIKYVLENFELSKYEIKLNNIKKPACRQKWHNLKPISIFFNIPKYEKII